MCNLGTSETLNLTTSGTSSLRASYVLSQHIVDTRSHDIVDTMSQDFVHTAMGVRTRLSKPMLLFMRKVAPRAHQSLSPFWQPLLHDASEALGWQPLGNHYNFRTFQG